MTKIESFQRFCVCLLADTDTITLSLSTDHTVPLTAHEALDLSNRLLDAAVQLKGRSAWDR
jgi:hypothetical protein